MHVVMLMFMHVSCTCMDLGHFPCMQHAGYMNTDMQLKCDQRAMVWVT